MFLQYVYISISLSYITFVVGVPAHIAYFNELQLLLFLLWLGFLVSVLGFIVDSGRDSSNLDVLT